MLRLFSMWLVVVSIQCDLQWNEAHNVYTNTDNVARDARQAYRKRQASVKFNILLDVLRFRLIRCDRAWENRLQRYHRSAATLCTVHTCVHWCLPCYGTDSFWRIKCFMFFFSVVVVIGTVSYCLGGCVVCVSRGSLCTALTLTLPQLALFLSADSHLLDAFSFTSNIRIQTLWI